MRKLLGLLLFVAVSMLVSLVWWAPAARAGGGPTLNPDRDHYRPGDAVHLRGEGWGEPLQAASWPATLTTVGPQPVRIPIGQVQATPARRPGLQPYLALNLWFTMPKVADGTYQVAVRQSL